MDEKTLEQIIKLGHKLDMGHYNPERKKVAEKHTAEMNTRYSSAIERAIINSKTYRDNVGLPYNNVGNIPNIIVDNIGTTEAIHKYGNLPTALNFASFKYPGGGFIKGSIAQEEAICHDSFLYNVIGNEKFADDYEYNRAHLNNGLYANFGIFSPGILFMSDEKNHANIANIITVPAPNKGVYDNEIEDILIYKDNKYDDVLNERIKFVLDIAEANEVKTLILGAFGCGVFKNDPIKVANCFKGLLMNGNYNFNTVVFAIPAGKNYDAFNNVFTK